MSAAYEGPDGDHKEQEARAYLDGRNEGREEERERLRDLIEIAIGNEESCDCETDQVAHAHAASVLRDLQESLGTGRSAAAERDRLLKLAEEMGALSDINPICDAAEKAGLCGAVIDGDMVTGWNLALREFIRRAKEGKGK